MPLKHISDFKTCFQALDKLNNKIDSRFLNDLIRKANLNSELIKLNTNQNISINTNNINKEFYDVYKYICDFCESTNNYKIFNKSYDLDNNLVKRFIKSYDKYKPTNVIISISGGVDSMILAHLFKSLSNKLNNQNKIINISLVHINYNNRDVASEEMNFIKIL